ncbi:PREDICTED: ribonuclease 3-like protein 3 [Ipomoea nil]|uniref:ribonuclease 3-like protein 3 n=1 Tax=Ipomoea nil TaxID=35883 RepID=UPI000900B882|nr:PREDICTED: ribonuclease 3-like protein 3 [Ipomoea nil]
MEAQELKREEAPVDDSSLGLQSSGEDETVVAEEKLQVAASAASRGGGEKDEEEEEAWKNNLEEVEEIIGYKFNDPKLLRQAFTHSSYRSECSWSYERLEYMGDSVLNMLITKEHYFLYPELPPGKLTPLRAFNVDTEKLARVAIKYNLHKYLRHRKPLLEGQVNTFKKAASEYPFHSAGLIDPPKALADIVESLLGAVYIDSGCSTDTTWPIVKSLLQPMITPTNLEQHPVSKFYEICQKRGWKVETVDVWEETGEIHVYVNGEFAGKSKFKGKKLTAHNRAAHNAYYNYLMEKLSLENGNKE